MLGHGLSSHPEAFSEGFMPHTSSKELLLHFCQQATGHVYGGSFCVLLDYLPGFVLMSCNCPPPQRRIWGPFRPHLCLTVDLKFWTFWKVSRICCDMQEWKCSAEVGIIPERLQGYKQGDLRNFQ